MDRPTRVHERSSCRGCIRGCPTMDAAPELSLVLSHRLSALQVFLFYPLSLNLLPTIPFFVSIQSTDVLLTVKSTY